jgi:DNA polymerase (family 10)
VKGVKGRIKYVFNSLEIDIMPDGSLPVKDSALDLLDFALVSIHSSFGLSRDEMTKRVLFALSHPRVKIFAHPTARKLNEREGVELNWPKIFEFCLDHNKWLEIDADPMRLDLPDSLVREAVKVGVKLTLGTDAHHKDSLDNMRYGVSVARRGWAKKDDIVNSRDLKDFQKMLK